jgi:hypothetical protein
MMIHVFVDYENIKRINPAVLALDGATFTLLLGPQNRTLNVALVEQLMTRAATVELVRLEEAGRNAVDFALTYYLGRRVVTDPTAQFYLISKDTGYDPLIAHLRSRKVRVRRFDDFEGLLAARETTTPRATLPAPPAERAVVKKVSVSGSAKGAATAPSSAKVIAKSDPTARVLAHLRKHPNNRPRRQQTLMRQLAAQSLKGATKEEIERFVATLVKSGHLEIDPKGSITYRLEEESK